MKHKHTDLKRACTVFAAHLSLRADARHGWVLAGSDPGNYYSRIQADRAVAGRNPVSLKSIGHPQGFGTLMQTFNARAYRGQRVRLSSYVRSDSVEGWAGLWMRVDGPRDEPLAFDNMQNRPISGTTRWTNYDVVLDVPSSAEGIAVGLILAGAGQVWLEEFSLTPVEKRVPVTGPTLGGASGGVRPSPAAATPEV